MQRIIINNDERKQQPAQAKLLNPNVQYGKYFEEFVESQKKGPKPDGSVKKTVKEQPILGMKPCKS